jgi:oligoendopeptidase F
MSAALALSRQVLETGDPGRYLGFLQSGGKQFPIDTLKAAGVDMTSPQPVESALQLFAQRVDELAGLLGIDLDNTSRAA